MLTEDTVLMIKNHMVEKSGIPVYDYPSDQLLECLNLTGSLTTVAAYINPDYIMPAPFPSPRFEAVMINPLRAAKYQTPAGYLHCLFHEMAHATGRQTRLCRIGVSDWRKRTHLVMIVEEIIADTVAITLLRHFNFSDETREKVHSDYIANYKFEATWIMADLSLFIDEIQLGVKETVDYILKNWLADLNLDVDAAKVL